jgi:hypothetical protein
VLKEIAIKIMLPVDLKHPLAAYANPAVVLFIDI